MVARRVHGAVHPCVRDPHSLAPRVLRWAAGRQTDPLASVVTKPLPGDLADVTPEALAMAMELLQQRGLVTLISE